MTTELRRTVARVLLELHDLGLEVRIKDHGSSIELQIPPYDPRVLRLCLDAGLDVTLGEAGRSLIVENPSAPTCR